MSAQEDIGKLEKELSPEKIKAELQQDKKVYKWMSVPAVLTAGYLLLRSFIGPDLDLLTNPESFLYLHDLVSATGGTISAAVGGIPYAISSFKLRKIKKQEEMDFNPSY